MLMLVITIGQAIVYVYTGMYGDPAAVGVVNSVLIVFQVRRACSYAPSAVGAAFCAARFLHSLELGIVSRST